MSTGSATSGTTPATPAVIPVVAKTTLLHNFFATVQKDVAGSAMLINALQSNAALPGIFAKLETIRTDLVDAYATFQAVETLLSGLSALSTASNSTGK